MHLEEIRALEKRYVMQTYGRNEIALVSGEGARLRRRLAMDDSQHTKNPLERDVETTPF